jgi:hypothetical protein
VWVAKEDVNSLKRLNFDDPIITDGTLLLVLKVKYLIW